MELVLRYIIFSQASIDNLKKAGDVGKYLTEKMEIIAKDESFSRDAAYCNFKKVFDILGKNLGADAFKRFSPKKKRHEGGFSVSAFEAVTAGVREREKKGWIWPTLKIPFRPYGARATSSNGLGLASLLHADYGIPFLSRAIISQNETSY